VLLLLVWLPNQTMPVWAVNGGIVLFENAQGLLQETLRELKIKKLINFWLLVHRTSGMQLVQRYQG